METNHGLKCRLLASHNQQQPMLIKRLMAKNQRQGPDQAPNKMMEVLIRMHKAIKTQPNPEKLSQRKEQETKLETALSHQKQQMGSWKRLLRRAPRSQTLHLEKRATKPARTVELISVHLLGTTNKTAWTLERMIRSQPAQPIETKFHRKGVKVLTTT